jgi:hypothetical protein
MKVAEMIARLQQMDPELPVVYAKGMKDEDMELVVSVHPDMVSGKPAAILI